MHAGVGPGSHEAAASVVARPVGGARDAWPRLIAAPWPPDTGPWLVFTPAAAGR